MFVSIDESSGYNRGFERYMKTGEQGRVGMECRENLSVRRSQRATCKHDLVSANAAEESSLRERSKKERGAPRTYRRVKRHPRLPSVPEVGSVVPECSPEATASGTWDLRSERRSVRFLLLLLEVLLYAFYLSEAWERLG